VYQQNNFQNFGKHRKNQIGEIIQFDQMNFIKE